MPLNEVLFAQYCSLFVRFCLQCQTCRLTCTCIHKKTFLSYLPAFLSVFFFFWKGIPRQNRLFFLLNLQLYLWAVHDVSKRKEEFTVTYHIWVIKVTRSGNKAEVSSIVTIKLYDTSNTVPGILYVSIVPPDVTITSYLLIIRLQIIQIYIN